MQSVMWFTDLSVGDVDLVGGTGADLGELTGAGLPVPPGFVVTASAYRDAIDHSGIRSQLAALLDRINIEDPASLKEIAAKPKSLVAGMSVSPGFRTRCSTPTTGWATGSGWRCGRPAPARTPRAPPSPA